MNQININGKKYPCRQVMGGLIALKRQYGVEVGQVGSDPEMLSFLVYSYTRCTCQSDGVAFDMDFETFSNSIELSDIITLTQGQDVKKKE